MDEARLDADEEKVSVTIVCAGSPYCELATEQAVIHAQKSGCKWCSKVYIEPDGREYIEQPGMA